jgi:hypothetical protein
LLATLSLAMMRRKSKSSQKLLLKTQVYVWIPWVVTISQTRAMVEESTEMGRIKLERI